MLLERNAIISIAFFSQCRDTFNVQLIITVVVLKRTKTGGVALTVSREMIRNRRINRASKAEVERSLDIVSTRTFPAMGVEFPLWRIPNAAKPRNSLGCSAFPGVRGS